tara:strand:+ start:1340 stop:2164 length:825 start_codon:yes stop_codon:yes gene_type:complete
MSQNKRPSFCDQCGNGLAPTSKFCGSCGVSIAADITPMPTRTQSDNISPSKPPIPTVPDSNPIASDSYEDHSNEDNPNAKFTKEDYLGCSILIGILILLGLLAWGAFEYFTDDYSKIEHDSSHDKYAITLLYNHEELDKTEAESITNYLWANEYSRLGEFDVKVTTERNRSLDRVNTIGWIDFGLRKVVDEYVIYDYGIPGETWTDMKSSEPGFGIQQATCGISKQLLQNARVRWIQLDVITNQIPPLGITTEFLDNPIILSEHNCEGGVIKDN